MFRRLYPDLLWPFELVPVPLMTETMDAQLNAYQRAFSFCLS